MTPENLFISQHHQLIWGTIVLSVCAIIHVGFLAIMVEALAKMGDWVERRTRFMRTALLTGAAFAMIVSSHTIQVWLWAYVLIHMGAFDYLYNALYFSLVTYTTVGYGDVVLPVEFRVFGAFGGVTGILCFGISTAFLVSLISRLLPRSIE
ncbi:two pore domain potassium channel family protein [Shimia sp. R11_0]|uniref:Voltage-gated potassium channel n=1 Tax=Shimia marina TaxID=321267 RepID=A0A0N7LSL7_9RHOB|nr:MULTISPECIES: potassium channel family protein [Shimia]MBO9476585.1 two pore domain potassium channel family protein [Shimia sp. R11_0]CUH53972.1 voltage-gated potassium channel [Shimia marina]SFE17929.1 Ion channel [Shimia marina]